MVANHAIHCDAGTLGHFCPSSCYYLHRPFLRTFRVSKRLSYKSKNLWRLRVPPLALLIFAGNKPIHDNPANAAQLLVEVDGFEPTTYSLQSYRSPN